MADFLLSGDENLFLDGFTTGGGSISDFAYTIITWDPSLQDDGGGRAWFTVTQNADFTSVWVLPNWKFLLWIVGIEVVNEEIVVLDAPLSTADLTVSMINLF